MSDRSSWSRAELLSSAADGEREALTAVAASDTLAAEAVERGLGPALGLAARRHGVEGSSAEKWLRHLRSAAANWLLVVGAAESVSRSLSAAGVLWVPIKGFDVGTRFYETRERRPIGDLDILVSGDELASCREALVAHAWSWPQETARLRRYTSEEGYAYQLGSVAGSGLGPAVLEVHFRLWGMVPSGLEAALLAEAIEGEADPFAPARILPAHAYLLAAVHAWNNPLPRGLLDWRDLEAIRASGGSGSDDQIAESVAECALRWSVELPLCLSAEVASRLSGGSAHERIVELLEPRLSRGEARQLERLRRSGVDSVSLPGIVLARLLAGRPSRAGWRSVWRRVWAHPGRVEAETPDALAWPRRRWRHLARSLRRG